MGTLVATLKVLNRIENEDRIKIFTFNKNKETPFCT